ncbi:hypothetical protein [Chryseobacterium sp. 18068]|uniref:hypothetical protein n=1 Tax=Chryseobacterium sp. 18068 TaxID=2681414 RepID=UPI00135B0DCF|nr:hypothetical protein [Chryseobacterium sp. 18068]
MMEKKLLKKRIPRKKIILWTFLGFVTLLAIFPFALDFYLQKKLPDLINEKTPYKVVLKDFNLSLLKGNLTVNDLEISTKNPKDQQITQINGKIKNLNITDLNIWKAVFSNKYHADQFTLTDSDIKIKLAALKKDQKPSNKKIDLHINNIAIHNVNAAIENGRGKTVFRGQHINVQLRDIKQSASGNKIPIAFSEFKIDAENVQIGVNDFYEIDAKKINAANKTLQLVQFHLKPIQAIAQYNSKNVFDFSTQNLAAKDFNISQDSLIVSDITFTQPDLKVYSTGKRTVDKSNNSKEIDLKIGLKNITFQKGKINVFQVNKEKTASVENFNFKMSDIVFDKNTVKEKIPFRFTKHDIEAENIYFKADQLQAVKIKSITSRNANITIDGFQVLALGTSSTKDVFSVSTDQIKILNNKSRYIGQNLDIKLDGIEIHNPSVQIITATKNKKKTQKATTHPPFTAHIGFIRVNNGKVLQNKQNVEKLAVGKPDIKVDKVFRNTERFKEKMASVENFNFKMSDIVFDKNTVKEKIPFRFTKHDIEAENIYFKADPLQAVKIKNIASRNANITIDGFQVLALGKSSTKDVFSVSTDQIKILNNKSTYIGQNLDIKLDGIEVNNPSVQIITVTKNKKKNQKATIPQPFTARIGFIRVNNGKVSQKKQNVEKLAIGKLDIKVDKVFSNTELFKKDIPFKTEKNYVNAKNIRLDAGKYYYLKVAEIKTTGKNTDISEFNYLPKYSRAGFSKVIAKESDLYTIKVKKINIKDHNTQLGKNSSIDLSKISIDGLHCNIYHDLAPPDDIAVRYLFSKKLRDVKIPLFIKEISIKNSDLEYEEDAEKSNIPGKLTFNNFQALITNVNNAKIKGRPTIINTDASFDFYGKAETKVNWKFDVKDLADKFTIKGDVQKLSADNVNLFVRPYLNITLDGNIDYLKFDYYGSQEGIAGKFYFKYNDMYVNFLNKKGNERKFLNTIANWFVKNESKGEPGHVVIDKKREPERSFFSMLWQGIMEGLKKYLI